MRFMHYALAISAIVALFAAPKPLHAQDIEAGSVDRTTRGITVTGTAEVRTAPNVAYVTAGVKTRASDAQKAASTNAAAMNKIMQAIRGAGIAEKDIETVQYTLQQAYEYPPNQTAKLVGYDATNLVKVTVRDISKVGSVIDAVTNAGANVVQDVSFGLSEDSTAKVRAEALTKAVVDARSKAEVMAKALGVVLGKVISANESSPSVVSPMFSRAEMGAAAAPTPISPQQIVVRATVNLVYSFR